MTASRWAYFHAKRLRDVIRTELADPHAFAVTWGSVTETELAPWYQATVAGDRARLADIEAACTGSGRRRASDPAAALVVAFARAMAHDPDIFRAYMEIAGCLEASPRRVRTVGLRRPRRRGLRAS